MIPKSRYINKIRELGYTFKDRQKRTELWRKQGGVHFISVPIRDLLEEQFVALTLRQAGCTIDEINLFISAAKI